MTAKIVESIGLILDIFGAVVLARGLMITNEDAISLGLSRFAGETEEENLRQPAVRDRLIQSRNAKIGLVLLVLGFLGQLAANWIS
jgi:hypothetical protein